MPEFQCFVLNLKSRQGMILLQHVFLRERERDGHSCKLLNINPNRVYGAWLGHGYRCTFKYMCTINPCAPEGVLCQEWTLKYFTYWVSPCKFGTWLVDGLFRKIQFTRIYHPQVNTPTCTQQPKMYLIAHSLIVYLTHCDAIFLAIAWFRKENVFE